MTAARRRLLQANGVFLVVVGGTQVVFELRAYYAGAGPYGYIFEDSPYAIGWIEAHGADGYRGDGRALRPRGSACRRLRGVP